MHSQGKTLYANAAGVLNFDPNSPPFTLESVCYVASLTKLATSISVLQIVEKGLIGLDDDVGSLIPELAVGEKDILKGISDDGTPILAKTTKPITLR